MAGNTENLGHGHGHGGGGGVDGGAADAAIDEDAICTRTPDEWLADCGDDAPIHCGRGHGRCSHHPRGHGRGHLCDGAPSRSECRDLRTGSVESRELTALRINLRVNDDLEDLHFARGLSQGETLGDLSRARDPSPMRVADANRAFAGCIDRGVLVPWIETPVCGGDDRGRGDRGRGDRGRGDRGRGPGRDEVSGPEGMRCMAYDSACTRGRYDEESACCTGVLLPAGTVCGTELLCDGEGACAPAASVPPGDRIGADFDWVAFFPEGVGDDGLLPEQMAEVVEVSSPPTGMPAASLEIRVAARLDQLDPGIDVNPNDPPIEPTEPDGPPDEVAPYVPEVLAIVPSSLASTERITILRSPLTSPVYAMAYAGPEVPHALVFATRFQQPVTELYVVEGPLDDLPAVSSDGSTAGATLVPCVAPGDPIGDPIGDPAPGLGARCTIIDGQAVLVGSNVSLAWVPQLEEAPAFDVITGGFDNITPIDGPIGGWIFGPTGYPVPTCAPQSCTTACGESSVRLCLGGRLTPCLAPALDTCDGIDNNCNGVVDEGSNPSCNDDIGCTLDYCALGACVNRPFGAMCRTGLSSCAVGVCTPESGLANASPARGIFVGDLPAPLPPGRPTGCSIVAGHAWCTSAWDSCSCNGPEMCNVLPPAGRGNAGCTSAPTFLPGAFAMPPTPMVPATILRPCDLDNSICTTDAGCCEPADDLYCRGDRLLATSNPAAWRARELVCSVATTAGAWSPLVPPPFAIGSIGPVRCTAPIPEDASSPRRRLWCPPDGNPCTVDGCVPLTGACTMTPTPRGGAGVPNEQTLLPDGSIFDVPLCTGEVPGTAGCESLMCDGDADLNPVTGEDGPLIARCAPGATRGATRPFNPLDRAFPTDACTALQASFSCENPRCIIAPSTSPSAPLNRASCVPFGTTSLGEDDSRCEFPQSCLGGGMCVAGTPPNLEYFPEVRAGCLPPAGMCFVGDGCVPANTRPGGLAGCMVCQPGSPWSLTPLPAGSPCTAVDECTINERCNAVGLCVGEYSTDPGCNT